MIPVAYREDCGGAYRDDCGGAYRDDCGVAYRDDCATNCETCVTWVTLSWSEKAGIPAAPARTLLSTAAAAKRR